MHYKAWVLDLSWGSESIASAPTGISQPEDQKAQVSEANVQGSEGSSPRVCEFFIRHSTELFGGLLIGGLIGHTWDLSDSRLTMQAACLFRKDSARHVS